MIKTKKFVNRMFVLSKTDNDVRCPCGRCRNCFCRTKKELSLDLCRHGFMPNYDVWVHHDELPGQNTSEVRASDRTDYDRMEEMLNDIRLEFQPDSEEPPTPEVQKFFQLLRASEEPLHEHTTVTILAFVTRLMAIKSKFAFSNNCYKELINLISDVLPTNHKLPRDMYQSKKLLSSLGMDSKKIDLCQENCMLF